MKSKRMGRDGPYAHKLHAPQALARFRGALLAHEVLYQGVRGLENSVQLGEKIHLGHGGARRDAAGYLPAQDTVGDKDMEAVSLDADGQGLVGGGGQPAQGGEEGVTGHVGFALRPEGKPDVPGDAFLAALRRLSAATDKPLAVCVQGDRLHVFVTNRILGRKVSSRVPPSAAVAEVDFLPELDGILKASDALV